MLYYNYIDRENSAIVINSANPLSKHMVHVHMYIEKRRVRTEDRGRGSVCVWGCVCRESEG